MLGTLDVGNPKAPFSKATIPKCRVGRDSYPWIAPLYLWSLPYNASSTIFSVFSLTRPGIEPWSPGPMANTLNSWLVTF